MALLYTLLTLPIGLFGYIQGPWRTEAADGEIHWHFPISSWVINFKPYKVGNKTFALTHLQKTSRFGFLITWPFCVHVWFMWKEQRMDANDEWIPGSEQGIYCRTPGYRKDIAYGMKWTWGYCGLHWD